jgi:hypothetical protein
VVFGDVGAFRSAARLMFEARHTVKVGDSPRMILAAFGQDWDADKWRELMHFNRVSSFELAVFGVPNVGTEIRALPVWCPAHSAPRVSER